MKKRQKLKRNKKQKSARKSWIGLAIAPTLLGLFALIFSFDSSTTLPTPAIQEAQCGDLPCTPGQVADSVINLYGKELTIATSYAKKYGDDVVEISAKELRNTPGVATVSVPLFDSERMMRGTDMNAGLIPSSIAATLNGKSMSNSAELRSEFWKTVSNSRYASEFSRENVEKMQQGFAPATLASQQVGQRRAYELHHIKPIQHGGSVYDLSNLMVVTPRFHLDVLNRSYHYGS